MIHVDPATDTRPRCAWCEQPCEWRDLVLVDDEYVCPACIEDRVHPADELS